MSLHGILTLRDRRRECNSARLLPAIDDAEVGRAGIQTGQHARLAVLLWQSSMPFRYCIPTAIRNTPKMTSQRIPSTCQK